MEITLIPCEPIAGWILPFSTCKSEPSKPSIFGTFGPVISISIIPTFLPLRAKERANPVATVDLPTPPLPDKTIILCLIS